MRLAKLVVLLVPLSMSAQMATTVGLPPNSVTSLKDSAVAYQELIFNDGSVLEVAPTLKSVEITCVKLTLNGKGTIVLTPGLNKPTPPATPGGQPQALNDNPPQPGAGGIAGGTGGNGTDGIGLTFSVQQLDAANGSLWIQTDGTPGGDGGNGGAGGKGSSGQQTCVKNPDGGTGGSGGPGGTGGRGGNTAKVTLKIGPNTIAPTQAQQPVAPSQRPALADTPGTIVISGAPGRGGNGGQGGPGGPGGEGHQSHFPCPTTDSNSGRDGARGPDGANGANGTFVP
jgi:hypothetical protein